MQRSTYLVLGTELTNRISHSNILIVGAGGIGCYLLKAMGKSGFTRITILDIDIIEETNLNRQFYFRKEDIKDSKATVLKKRIEAICPNLKITAIHDSIYNTKYDRYFFSQFTAVIAAIDSYAGRRHLSNMAAKVGLPLVDGGTGQFQGQTRSIIRYETECHHCTPEMPEHENFAACTLRNSPERPVHCIAYAKNLYDCIFGSEDKGDIHLRYFYSGNETPDQLKAVAIRLFNAIFSYRVDNKGRSNSKTLDYTPITYDEAMQMTEQLTNPPTTANPEEQRLQYKSPYEQYKIWSLKRYAEVFTEAVVRTLLEDKVGSLNFEKDDEKSMLIVYCITTLRTFNFMNRQNPKNAHKYLTFYEVKDIAGQVQPTVSSTNAIASALEVTYLIKIIEGANKKYSFISFNNSSTRKIMSFSRRQPNIWCKNCSKRCHYMEIQCDFDNFTLNDINEYLRQYMAHNRNIEAMYSQGSMNTILSETFTYRLAIPLRHQFGIVSENESIYLCYNSTEMVPLDLSVYLKHKQDSPIVSSDDGRRMRCNLMYFKRAIFNEQRNFEKEIMKHFLF